MTQIRETGKDARNEKAIAEKKKTLAGLKAELAERKRHCKKCDRWECGYCAVPKLELQERIEILEREIAA